MGERLKLQELVCGKCGDSIWVTHGSVEFHESHYGGPYAYWQFAGPPHCDPITCPDHDGSYYFLEGRTLEGEVSDG